MNADNLTKKEVIDEYNKLEKLFVQTVSKLTETGIKLCDVSIEERKLRIEIEELKEKLNENKNNTMKYKNFETLITKMQSLQQRSLAMCELGLDTVNYEDDFYQVIELLIDEAFSDYNREWIDWFLYERVTPGGEILKAHDQHGKEICYDIKSLWEEITN
jgi:regulator of replication initiation timing